MKLNLLIVGLFLSCAFPSSQEFEVILDEKKHSNISQDSKKAASSDSDFYVEMPNSRFDKNIENRISFIEKVLEELREQLKILNNHFLNFAEETREQFFKISRYLAPQPPKDLTEITNNAKLRLSKKVAKFKGYAFDNEILFSLRPMKLSDVLQIERDLDIESSEFYQKNMVLKNKEIDDLKYKLQKSEAACNSLRLMILDSSSSSNSSGLSRSNVVICEKCNR